MKTTLTAKLLTFMLFLWGSSFCFAQSIAELKNIKDPHKQLENVLSLPVDYKKDSLTLKQNLQPLWDWAQKENSTPLKWAYYMLMADGFSIAFDQVNPRTNQYYHLAEELTKGDDYPELKMIGNIRQGYYYYTYRELKQAFPFFLQANQLYQQVDLQKIPLVDIHFNFIASFYSYIGDQEKAVTYLKAALAFTEPVSRNRINMLNAIGVYLKRDSLPDEAYNFYTQALHVAKLAKDSVWIGIISGNLGEYDWKKGDKAKAIELTKQNIDLSLRFNEPLDAMRANLELSKMYIDQKQWVPAKQYVLASMALMEDKPYFLKFKMDAAKALADIAHGLGQNDEELAQLNTYFKLRDALDERGNTEEMQKISWQWETERFEQTLQLEANKRNLIKQTYQYVGIFLLLVFVIILLLINRSKNRIQIRSGLLEKEQMTLSFEKQLVDQELLLLKSSLQEFTDTIKRNDLTIQNLRREIVNGPAANAENQEQVSESLNVMLQTHIMTDERWLKFKNVFEKVYPDYLQQQKMKFPKLSENDLRLIALSKLDLSNRSMGDLLGVSIEGVKKAKQRLKKKIGEEHDEETNIS